MAISPFSIAIHGGAGILLKEDSTSLLDMEIRTALKTSAITGYEILKKGGDALDATVAAVRVLEDCPHFNAAKGSVLTHTEMVEMDASVMHGKEMEAGAVAAVRHIKNPIELAKDVLRKSQHVFLVGEGAEEFAFEQGHDYTEQDYFFTEQRYEQLNSEKDKSVALLSESRDSLSFPDDKKLGTVGAVALDRQGNLAAATSSGGVTNKKYGRVGASPIIGAGTFAENHNVAISTTGIGECFIRKMVAADVAARMRYLKEDIYTASEMVIQGELKRIGGEGGLIAIDHKGNIHNAMNGSGMYRASIDKKGELNIAILVGK